jgi:hypothetical protein
MRLLRGRQDNVRAFRGLTRYLTARPPGVVTTSREFARTFGVNCERPVATCSTIRAWAARIPAASRVWLHALDTAKSLHAQCHALPDSKLTRKRSIM